MASFMFLAILRFLDFFFWFEKAYRADCASPFATFWPLTNPDGTLFLFLQSYLEKFVNFIYCISSLRRFLTAWLQPYLVLTKITELMCQKTTSHPENPRGFFRFNRKIPGRFRFFPVPVFPGSTRNLAGGSGWKAPVFPVPVFPVFSVQAENMRVVPGG